MSFLPQLSVGLSTSWWFSAAYLLGNFSIIFFYPRRSWIRFFEMPNSNSAPRKAVVGLSRFLWVGLVIYALFVPIGTGMWRSNAGMLLAVVGMVLYQIAILNCASTPVGEPVVKGLFRLSRNPIYTADAVFWLGVGIFAGSWIIVAAKIVGRIVSHWQILDEETFCLERYGDSYRDYMKRVPRYFLWF